MLRYFLCIMGIIGSFVMIVKREAIGDMMGEPWWSKPLGGVYALVVYIAIFIFFWSLAEITNSTNVLFHFLTYFIAGSGSQSDF